VFKVKHIKTEQEFALKKQLKLSKNLIKLDLLDEYAKMVRLASSNFVPAVYGTFQNDEAIFILMELCDEDIDSFIDSYYEASLCEMTEKECQSYKNTLKFVIANIVQGLEDIHEQGKMLHKDIKPKNLLFDSKGYIKITDFGISEDIITENSHQNIGTIGYMAPEVAKGENHGPTSDFFGLGVIMYEFILGESPFKSCERNELIKEMEAKEIKIAD
jgi:serine/threonine protein kinase